jgi:hypothetical protein
MRSWGLIVCGILLAAVWGRHAEAGGLTGKGFTFGWQQSEAFQETYVGSQPLSGLDGGFAAEWTFTPHIAFFPELVYATRGFRVDLPIEHEIPYRMHYLLGSALARFQYTDRGVHPSLLAGPELGWMFHANVDGEAENAAGEAWLRRFERIHYGLAVGLGLEGPLGHGRWMLDARYTLGLTDVLKRVHDGVRQPEARLRAYSVALKILYGTGP